MEVSRGPSVSPRVAIYEVVTDQSSMSPLFHTAALTTESVCPVREELAV
jgi:hypothetical protein